MLARRVVRDPSSSRASITAGPRAAGLLSGLCRFLDSHAWLFAFALVTRLAFQALTVGFETAPRGDAVQYDAVAWSVAQGGPYTAGAGDFSHRAPGYPWLLAGLYALAGHSLTAARLLQALLGAATCSLVLAFGRRWFGAAIGVPAAWLLALFPYAIYWTGDLVSEPLVTVLTVAATAILALGASRPRGAALWAALCALAALTRPNMALLFPLGLAWIVARPGPRRQRAAAAAAATAVFLLVLTPWTVRNYRVHGRFVPITTMGGTVLWEGNNPLVAADPEWRGRAHTPEEDADRGLAESERDARDFRRATDFMKAQPVATARLAAWKFLRLWNLFPRLDSAWQRSLAAAALLPVLGLSLVGLAAAWRMRDLRIVPLLFPVAAVIVTGVVYWADARIRAPADPMLLQLAAYGLAAVRGFAGAWPARSLPAR